MLQSFKSLTQSDDEALIKQMRVNGRAKTECLESGIQNEKAKCLESQPDIKNNESVVPIKKNDKIVESTMSPLVYSNVYGSNILNNDNALISTGNNGNVLPTFDATQLQSGNTVADSSSTIASTTNSTSSAEKPGQKKSSESLKTQA